MGYVDCTPSNSSPSEQSLPVFPDDEYDPTDFEGLPRKCVCGSPTKVKPSTAYAYLGRNEIVCADYCEKGTQTFKWWDEAVTEDVQRLKFKEIPTMKIALKFLRSDVTAISGTLSNDYESAAKEIAKLGDVQHQNEDKIDKLEKMLSKKGRLISSSFELRLMVATVLVLAIVSMYLHL